MKKQRYPKPTAQELREHFFYHNDGYLLWAKSKGASSIGTVAGVRTDRYIMIRFNGVLHNMRDLIWIYHHLVIPHGGLKHENGNVFDNRIENIVPRKVVEQRIHDFHHRAVSFL